MYKRKNPMDYTGCPVRIPIDILSGSWKAWLIQEINKGILRPVELQKSIKIASRRVLGKQLKELEEQGIVEKTIYPEIPLKVEYRLTQAGKDLIPVLACLQAWGDKHKESVLGRKEELI